MSQPLFPSAATLGHAYQQSRYAVPAVYNGNAAAPASQAHSDAHANGPSPLSSSALMFGQEQSAYRSAMHMPVLQEPAASMQLHQLAQANNVARAMHVAAAPGAYEPQLQHEWQAQQTFKQMQPLDANVWAATAALKQMPPAVGAKPAAADADASLFPSSAPELPALQQPLSSLGVSAAPGLTRAQSLPCLPVYLESSCFSLAKAAMAPRDLWTNLKTHLRRCGVVVAERGDRRYELECQASNGMACSQFNVYCYSGHYRDCDAGASGQSGAVPLTGAVQPAQPTNTGSGAVCYTVDFQRMSGCSVAFMQLFQMMLVLLKDDGQAAPLDIESKLAPAEPVRMLADTQVPCASDSDSVDVDCSDLDLSLLPIPSLRHASTVGAAPGCVPQVALSPCASVLDSLHDLLTSGDPCSQVAGLHALALCLDGSQPQRERQLMAEVAAMLCEGQSEHVKQVASMLIAKAAQLPSAQLPLLQVCLPACIDSLVAPVAAAAASSLDVCLAQSRSKCLLRACLLLSEALPADFQSVLSRGEGAAVRASKLKRHLLHLAAHTDEELRDLAIRAIREIHV